MTTAISNNSSIIKEGFLRKRSGRMQRWALRYFVLSETKLSYRLKSDSGLPIRGEFDLSPGCVLTEVLEDSTIKGRKLFSFWIVWPHDKRCKPSDEESKQPLPEPQHEAIDSDGDEDMIPNNTNPIKHKDLKQIVETEKDLHRTQQKKVEEQVENHKAHDANVRLGVKVAAVAVGGVIVGALTAGIGLVPYITVVGITAVAGGGAVALQYKRPSDSRLILACETNDDAISWKMAIEGEISRLEKCRKPMLPATADPQLISCMLGMSAGGSGWHTSSICEGIKLLEQSESVLGTRCRKAQLVVHSTPVNAFLSLMESHHWPRGGSIKVDKVIDDHADIVTVKLLTECKSKGFSFGKSRNNSHVVPREMRLCRFWKLDDDGVYLITFNTMKTNDAIDVKSTGKVGGKGPGGRDSALSKDPNSVGNGKSMEQPSFDAVITISPRRDHDEYDTDLPISLIVCTCQLSTDGWESTTEMENLMDDFLKQQLLDLRSSLTTNKYVYTASEREAKVASKLNTATKVDLMNPPVPNPSKNNRLRAVSPSRFLSSNQTSSTNANTEGLKDRPSSPSRNAVAPGAKNASRFGITTVQPGLEQDNHKVNESSAATITAAAPKRMRFLRSTSKGAPPAPPYNSSNNAANTGLADNSKLSHSSSQHSPSSSTMGGGAMSGGAMPGDNAFTLKSQQQEYKINRFSSRSRRKSKTANPKASNLRGQIAAKEYEVQRIEKMLKKQGATVGPDGTTLPGKASEVDLSAYQHSLKELQRMKSEYQTTTGVPYDQSTRLSSRFSGKFRYLGGTGNKMSTAISAQEGGNSSPMNLVAAHENSASPSNTGIGILEQNKVGDIAAIKGNLKSNTPIHWQLSRINDYQIQRQNDLENEMDRKTVIYFILTFTVVLSLSSIFATILPDLMLY